MNQTKPRCNDIRVRRAVSAATEGCALVTSTLEDHGIVGSGVPFVFVRDDGWSAEQLHPRWKHTVAEAKTLMEATGYR